RLDRSTRKYLSANLPSRFRSGPPQPRQAFPGWQTCRRGVHETLLPLATISPRRATLSSPVTHNKNLLSERQTSSKRITLPVLDLALTGRALVGAIRQHGSKKVC